MDRAWTIIIFIPLAPLLILLLMGIVAGGFLVTQVGHWIFDHRWYIFAFFCLVFLINFILILRESNIICSLSFLLASSSVLYYILNRSALFSTENTHLSKSILDYVLCVIFYAAISIGLTAAVIRISWAFLDDVYFDDTITESLRESVIYFLKMLAIGAVGWGINALIFYVIVPIYLYG